MYDSMSTGLACARSDLDLAVRGLPLSNSTDVSAHFEKLKEGLQADSLITHVHPISTARVPLIKLVNFSNRQSIDLTKVNPKATSKPLNVNLTFEVLGSYDIHYGLQCIDYVQNLCTQQHHLKSIVIVLKKLLSTHRLNIPYEGGINSYSLTLLVSAFIGMGAEMENVGMRLMEILRYYGTIFNEREAAVMSNCLVAVKNPTNRLFVSDSFRPGLNLAASANKFNEVKELFKSLYNSLKDIVENWNTSNYKGKLLEAMTYSKNL
eukprot:TRINITY_DN12987_c0_g1_i5.p1 TRINITY_DN12987_c0_g1~~TRINITY_DN12987_c0_g1_i5.p1  ORF type:complete len:264 (+),score=20.89 TRINITY_DN12987_c0_g1_i5:392-1183(+)